MRPSMHETLRDIAQLMARRSTCSRAQVGAVIARDGRIISTGYNGAPAGLPHCDHTCECDASEGYNFGQHRDFCPTVQPCTISVHAEANAIAFAAREGLATRGATMFTTLSPCVPCAQLIINAGIVKVLFAEWYRNNAGVRLLEDAGVRWMLLDSAAQA